jgi:uncharacterized membrane protein
MKRNFLKFLWAIIVILALLVGYLPINYLINGINEAYLELKSKETLGSTAWYSFLYFHMISGGMAILTGWIQFNQNIREKWTNTHRMIGKIYVIFALVCSISGVYVGVFATGGLIAAVGFITVACIYFYTTVQGFLSVKKGQILPHQNFMTYSYAVCLSAVSLRLAVPLSYLFTDDYVFSYKIIAWGAWIPNLAIAYWINKNRSVSFYKTMKK